MCASAIGINLKKHELTFKELNGTNKVISEGDPKLRSKMGALKVGQTLISRMC